MRSTPPSCIVVVAVVMGCTPSAPPTVSTLGVVQTPRPPHLDGDLSDPQWGLARRTDAFVETRTGGKAGVSAFAQALWDSRYLYVAVVAHDAWLLAPDEAHDSRLWEHDCVELMIQPPGGRGYFEIQVSPRGVVFDTRYDARRQPGPFGHVEWSSRARHGVITRGTVDDRRADAGYTIEIAIPWQAFSRSQDGSAAPSVGDRWRANFYVLDRTQTRQQAASWSPPRVGDFHVPARFGVLRFDGLPGSPSGANH